MFQESDGYTVLIRAEKQRTISERGKHMNTENNMPSSEIPSSENPSIENLSNEDLLKEDLSNEHLLKEPIPKEDLHTEEHENEADAPESSEPYAFDRPCEEAPQEDNAEPERRLRARKPSVFLSISCLILAASILISAILTSMPQASVAGGTTISGGVAERVVYVNGSGDAEEALAVEAAVAKMLPSTVTILVSTARGSGVGSGVILTSDGYIATNHHVVDGKDTIAVRLYGGKRYIAVLVASDPISDLALLKINATGLTPAEWGDSSTLLVGETVMAIGTPTGLAYSETVTRGIISCQSRPVKHKKDDGTLDYTLLMVQTDASVNPGNSGGALIDRNGQVIGIVANKTVFYENGTAYYADGMGLAIPSNAAKAILDALKNGEQIDRSAFLIPAARLGISGQNVSRETGYAATGVLVTGHNGSAYDASRKLEEGDVIVRMDSMRVTSIAEVLTLLEDYAPGTAITITVVRNGMEMQVDVILGSDALLTDP